MNKFREYKYILKDRIPHPVEDAVEWGTWIEKAHVTKEMVVKQETVNGIWVSTVFLGIDHGMSWMPGSKPLLFETMVFKSRGGEPIHEYIRRYATWIGAEHGHQKTVDEYLKKLNKVNGKQP